MLSRGSTSFIGRSFSYSHISIFPHLPSHFSLFTLHFSLNTYRLLLFTEYTVNNAKRPVKREKRIVKSGDNQSPQLFPSGTPDSFHLDSYWNPPLISANQQQHPCKSARNIFFENAKVHLPIRILRKNSYICILKPENDPVNSSGCGAVG